jgi:hypothetical protein
VGVIQDDYIDRAETLLNLFSFFIERELRSFQICLNIQKILLNRSMRHIIWLF